MRCRAKIKVVLVGLGRMGTNHLRVLRETPGFELVAVVDAKAERACRSRRRARSFAASPSSRSVDFDAAVIATPTATHHEVALELIAMGKHLLVEKPIASTFAAGPRAPRRRAGEGHEARRRSRRALQPRGAEAARDHPRGLARHADPLLVHARRRLSRHRAARATTSSSTSRCTTSTSCAASSAPVKLEHSMCHVTWREGVFDTAEIFLAAGTGASATVHVNWITPTKIRSIRVTGHARRLLRRLHAPDVRALRREPAQAGRAVEHELRGPPGALSHDRSHPVRRPQGGAAPRAGRAVPSLPRPTATSASSAPAATRSPRSSSPSAPCRSSKRARVRRPFRRRRRFPRPTTSGSEGSSGRGVAPRGMEAAAALLLAARLRRAPTTRVAWAVRVCVLSFARGRALQARDRGDGAAPRREAAPVHPERGDRGLPLPSARSARAARSSRRSPSAENAERKRAIEQNTWKGHLWSREDDRGHYERVQLRALAHALQDQPHADVPDPRRGDPQPLAGPRRQAAAGDDARRSTCGGTW